MIHFPLRHAGRYTAVLPGMDAAAEWLRAFDPALPDGRHPVDGERVFALVSSYATGPSTEKRFEAHRRHADVQWIASGAERILSSRPRASPSPSRTATRPTFSSSRSRGPAARS